MHDDQVTLDVQLSPARCDWATLRAATVEAERRGFAAVHVLDHLAGLPLGGTSALEAFALLGALCEVTERVELGTMVANVWNRRPGTLVTAAASIVEMSGRPFHLGVGAGAAPGTRWAREQELAGHELEPDVADRHARVAEVLDLCDATWADARDPELATFPLPRPRPTTIVGVNSVALARLAGERADGINVQWGRAERFDYLAAADEAAGGRPFLRTAYTAWDDALLDPDHPTRAELREHRIDRLVLAVFDDLAGWLPT